jgi:hypothetical protein
MVNAERILLTRNARRAIFTLAAIFLKFISKPQLLRPRASLAYPAYYSHACDHGLAFGKRAADQLYMVGVADARLNRYGFWVSFFVRNVYGLR